VHVMERTDVDWVCDRSAACWSSCRACRRRNGTGGCGDGVCALARRRSDYRASWHAYHLIGDVLRSEVWRSSRPATCVSRRRARIVYPEKRSCWRAACGLADRAGSEASRPARYNRVVGAARRWPWVVSSAVAAGFVAVLGTFALTRASRARVPQSRALSGASARRHCCHPRDAGVGGVASVGTARLGSFSWRSTRAESCATRVSTSYLVAHKQFAGARR
jgi:sigma-E factor negative regulatory protein RseA